MKLLIKKIANLCVLLSILSCSALEMPELDLPENISVESKVYSSIFSKIAGNIDRDKFYAISSSLGIDFSEFISDNYSFNVFEENGTRLELYTKNKKTNNLIIVANGGAFIAPYRTGRRDFFLEIFKDLDFNVLIVDYKMGYQRRFPEQNKEFLNGYRFALKLGYSPNKTVFIGDSSGGNIVTSSTVYLVDNNLPKPKALVLLSPYLDASFTLDSRSRNLNKDVFFGMPSGVKTPAKFQNIIPYFASVKDLKNRYVSPVFADNLYTFPNVFIQVGDHEILEDDSIVMSDNLKKYGVNVRLDIYQGMMHVFQMLNIPESKKAIKDVKEYISNILDNNEKGYVVSNDVIKKIRFDVNVENLPDEEYIKKFKKLGIDIENYIWFEKQNFDNSYRKYLNED